MSSGDFFKSKEQASASTLPPKGYFIIRLDGKAFSTFTRGLQKPFDKHLTNAMIETTKELCKHVQNVKLAYTQSDEISLVLCDLDEENTQLWFEGKIQKMVSVAASVATAHFNRLFTHHKGTLAYFDARVFRLESLEEVRDCLHWRQKDAYKNAITLIALKHFSHKTIDGVNTEDKIKMITGSGDDLKNYPQGNLFGYVIQKEKKQVSCVNRKTNLEETTTRTFWEERPMNMDTKLLSFDSK